ncbi:MAG: cytochrome c oxidase subunit II [Planctomycetaceae bacterium]|nr:cytochrome c oxidase subunit II [Planctomycetaceae bacterium]
MNSLPPLIPVAASTLAYQFEALFWYITIVTTLGGLAVYAALLYFCVAFRRENTTGSTPRILGSHRLELAWTIIPTIIFFSFFGWGMVVYTKAVHPPADAMEIFVIGKQWMWKAQYPNGQRVIIGGNPRNMTENERNSIGKLVLPINRPVRITMISEDVIHDFGVPAFRMKMDVLPGRYTTAWYHPTKLGEYHIFCDQYCGTWHSLMVGKISVIGEQEFDEWLGGVGSQQGTEHPVDGSLAQKGEQLFLKLQCIKCHSADVKAAAPVLEGLYGTRVPLKGGGGEFADAEYIKQSILKPRLKVAQGWEPIMPSYEGQVTPEDLDALVAYIRSLKRGQTPNPTDRMNPPVGAPTVRSEKKE